jgi:uncharacterized YigZ family protein
MSESYITLRESASDEVTIQKSRFIGYACPCAEEEEAQRFIQSLREKHRDARHHCYAYVIGENAGIMRYSDDGEPGGTAGMPMMDVLKKEKIVNCCVVVVRYFGGILLGTGGLVRAYTQGCKLAIAAAGLVRMELSETVRCRVSYSVWNQLQYAVSKMPVLVDGITYQDAVEFSLCTKKRDIAAAMESLGNISEGKIEFLSREEQYIPWPQEP